MPIATPKGRPPATLISWYAICGVLALLTTAIVRLTPYAVEAVSSDLTSFQALTMVCFTLAMAWSEGYRGFQKRYSPRVVARSLRLGNERPNRWTFFAPIVAMGLFRARRRVLITSWALTTMIITFIALLRITPQPWRGIVDMGVVVGLVWGTTSIVVFWIQALRGDLVIVDDGGIEPVAGR